MMDVKQKEGHRLFEGIRDIEKDAIAAGRVRTVNGKPKAVLSPDESRRTAKMIKRSQHIYRKAAFG